MALLKKRVRDLDEVVEEIAVFLDDDDREKWESWMETLRYQVRKLEKEAGKSSEYAHNSEDEETENGLE